MEWENIPNDLENAVGFVYKITNQISGKMYIGKKGFTKKVKKKVACRTKGKIVEKGKKKTVRHTVESDWENYYGSSAYLLEDIEKLGKENFKREFLAVASSKAELAIMELLYQLKYKVLWSDKYYNGIIHVRFHKKHFPSTFIFPDI